MLCLLVACLRPPCLGAVGARFLAKFVTGPKTELSAVNRTIALWKDRPFLPGVFFLEDDIPTLQGSAPRKVVPKRSFSPWVRSPPAPGRTSTRRHTALRSSSPITKSVLVQGLAQDNLSNGPPQAPENQVLRHFPASAVAWRAPERGPEDANLACPFD